MDGILRLEYLLLCNRMAHEVIFLGQPKCASSRAMVKNGANTKKTQKSHCKAQKSYSWCMFRLGSLNIWSSGRLGWFVGNTICGEMSSRKSGDGHVNLTVSCHIKRQLSGTCHVLFCCLELESNRTSATITRKAPFISGLMSKRPLIDLVCWEIFQVIDLALHLLLLLPTANGLNLRCSHGVQSFLDSSHPLSGWAVFTRFWLHISTFLMLGLDFLGHQKTFFKDCNVWENLLLLSRERQRGLPVAQEKSYFLYQHWITYYSR